MKDIIIKAKTLKREVILLIALFIIAFLINIYAIVLHEGQWSELYTQLHIVILLTLFLYIVTHLIRLVIWGGKFSWSMIKNKLVQTS